MDSGEAIFTAGENFSSFSELNDKIGNFQKKNFVQLYIRRSRSMEAAAKHALKKQFKRELKYSEIEYSCIHDKKNFKSTITGERPNQKYRCKPLSELCNYCSSCKFYNVSLNIVLFNKKG